MMQYKVSGQAVHSILVEVGRMLAETSHPCLRVHGGVQLTVPYACFFNHFDRVSPHICLSYCTIKGICSHVTLDTFSGQSLLLY